MKIILSSTEHLNSNQVQTQHAEVSKLFSHAMIYMYLITKLNVC